MVDVAAAVLEDHGRIPGGLCACGYHPWREQDRLRHVAAVVLEAIAEDCNGFDAFDWIEQAPKGTRIRDFRAGAGSLFAYLLRPKHAPTAFDGAEP